MCTHVHGLTLAVLTDAHHEARSIDHPITLIDDTTHVVVVVDCAGHVIARPQEQP